MHSRRYQVRLDEETLLALRRLADADDRSMAAQLRSMIKAEAAKRGVWTPRRPQAVRNTIG